MKYIIFLLLLISTTASAQKVLVKQGTVNGIYVYPATGSDSVTLTARGCGVPLTNMTAYRAAYRAGAVYVDTCANALYFYTPSLNKWFQVDAAIPTGSTLYFVEDSTNTQPALPADSTYYLLGSAPSGAQWSGYAANSIAFYNGSWSNIAGVLNDYAFTLDDQIYHRYNGSTWPVSGGIGLNNGGNTGVVRAGSLTPTYFDLITNNQRALTINRYQNATFWGSVWKMPNIRSGGVADSLIVFNATDGIGKISPGDYSGFILANPSTKQHRFANIDRLDADSIETYSTDSVSRFFHNTSTGYFQWDLGGRTNIGNPANLRIGNNQGSGAYGTLELNFASVLLTHTGNFQVGGFTALTGATIKYDGIRFDKSTGTWGLNPLGLVAPFIQNGPADANTAGDGILMYGGDANSVITGNLNGGAAILSGGKSTGTGTSEVWFYTASPAASGTAANTPTKKIFITGNGDARYMGNYGSYFTDSSLVDKNYVDSVVGGGGSGITALTGDVTASGTGSVAATLATVNVSPGTYGSATQAPVFVVNGKGLVTSNTNTTITPAVGSITGLGTNVATALAVNVGSTGAFVTNNAANTFTAKQTFQLTTNPLQIGYDASNYLTITPSSVGSTTFDLVGTSPAFAFSDNAVVNASFGVNNAGGANIVSGGTSYVYRTTNGASNSNAHDFFDLSGAGNTAGAFSFALDQSGTNGVLMFLLGNGTRKIRIANITPTDVTSTSGSEAGGLSFSTMSGGTTATPKFVITSTGNLYGTTIHNNATAPTGTTNQYIASGTYTPTLTNVTNIAASTAYQCQWIRVGNVVTVSGKVDIDVTLGVASELGMSLPIASNFTGEQNLGGTSSSSAAASLVTAIKGDATNDRAAFVFTAVSLTNDSYFFEFEYLIQ